MHTPVPTRSSPPARIRNLKEKTNNVTTQLWLCQITSVLPAVLMGDHLTGQHTAKTVGVGPGGKDTADHH